jgi:hypothetical protein
MRKRKKKVFLNFGFMLLALSDSFCAPVLAPLSVFYVWKHNKLFERSYMGKEHCWGKWWEVLISLFTLSRLVIFGFTRGK